MRIEPVEQVELVVSSCAVRLARHSQNAWARHVRGSTRRTCRVEPSGIWALLAKGQHHYINTPIWSRHLVSRNVFVTTLLKLCDSKPHNCLL